MKALSIVLSVVLVALAALSWPEDALPQARDTVWIGNCSSSSSDTPTEKSPGETVLLLAPQSKSTIHDFWPNVRSVPRLWKTISICTS
jgi:hypothetical protein